MILEFNLLGTPIAKQSTRFKTVKTGNKIFSTSFQTGKIKKETENLRWQIIEQLPDGFKPFENQVKILYLRFRFPYLKSFSKKRIKDIEQEGRDKFKTTKPDLDNLEKMLWDAMNGVVFTDDSIIYAKRNITKEYWHTPGILVILKGL
jgi:Holliday junction resolvase RusA-like endonuclease